MKESSEDRRVRSHYLGRHNKKIPVEEWSEGCRDRISHRERQDRAPASEVTQQLLLAITGLQENQKQLQEQIFQVAGGKETGNEFS